jgi:peroxiredoxin
MAATAQPLERGRPAPDFTLPGVDGRDWSLSEVAGARGTLVMFICNHCPYVRAIVEKIVRDAAELAPLGIGTVAISSNDARSYPEDSFANMKLFAREHGFGFPYLYDESQQIARHYGAVCTPDFFGFDAALRLEYRGRLDSSGRQGGAAPRRELVDAMRQIADTGRGPDEQNASIGCSIKWKS